MTEGVRDALVRQWRAIARGISSLDLKVPSRVNGWRNREVLAHLSLQPKLLRRFLETASTASAQVALVANLSGTSGLAQVIDEAARRATDADLDFARYVEQVIPALERADLTATISTLQGPIVLRDYLVTRCVEGVVHGGDFVDPIAPDPCAAGIACAALYAVVAERYPESLADAKSLPPLVWLDIATGRQAPPPQLQSCSPVMK